ncbi:MAG: chaperone modulator CbpM [Desulfomonilia bacterium]|jgi:MerR family transcriptional regulator/heat shock protein HspR|uniref:Chaperone modulatory protein CbpM n=1 Tax=anaerobic digester metagenome TaxID=1263854 RepID=A0A485M2K1_9ZZZZ|nr:chaperone modulator CbpM [Deltaproteobacteria bacterium]HPD22530.1 chaperone modulator CbpM [Deltaproteobacteria bacterium]HPX19403.1 chaperone modulator CbpM [Deltaproteobacteria bacterium]HRS57516.1 chaperone modulator CbpM [Desulfomonilia bacterium]HRV36793.1 chaperone modulator CbpM [Desulfomonilia bacterium]
MEKDAWTIKEVIEILHVDQKLVTTLEQEDIITLITDETGREKLLPGREIDKIRVARILIEEMDINLPGVEVILRMRQNMIDMRRQFDDILEDLARELRKRIVQRP